MVLPFDESVVNDKPISKESFQYPNFVGYLNPEGIPIDYSMPFGLGGHDNNPTTDYFMEFFNVRTKPYMEYTKSKFIPINYYRKYKCQKSNDRQQKIEENLAIGICQHRKKRINEKLNQLNESINITRSYNHKISPYALMDRDMFQFIANCYSNVTFNKGFGKDVRFMGKKEFYDKHIVRLKEEYIKKHPREICETDEQYSYRISSCYNFKREYDRYIQKELLLLLKEVIICYLGYHSVERTTKTITTSVPNIYETFYNYLLNGFTIFQLPRMVFDEELKTYFEVKQNEFFVPDRQIRLKDEIASIRKLVPASELHKYYR